MSRILIAVLTVAIAAQSLAQTTEQKAPPPPPTPGMERIQMTAGDFNGDGVSETVIYDSDIKGLRVIDYSGPGPVQTMGIFTKDVPSEMVAADLDGDGADELIAGEGLGGYNPKEGPQTDATVKIYKPKAKTDWAPVEIYRKATERPEVTSLVVKDMDGDGDKDILFSYFASKYVVDLRLAKREKDSWKITEFTPIRMGAHVDAGNVLGNGKQLIVVGRPYGDPPTPDTTTAIGDAFILVDGKRVALPATRGVSAVAVGNLDGSGADEIVIGDGWHSNYGKIARSRLAVISRQNNEWKYDLIEDFDGHMRFEDIELVDLTGDRRPEIVARAARAATLGNTVRVYERTADGWRGMTAGELAQAFAIGDFTPLPPPKDDTPEALEAVRRSRKANMKNSLVFGGQPPLPVSLSAKAPSWDARLGEEVITREVDPASLVNKSAPELKIAEWIGSDPMTLQSLRGKVVLLDFWATWCKPCIEMYPEMRKWEQELGPKGLVIVGITNHSRQTTADVRRFDTRNKLPWPLAIDPRDDTHRDYGVSPIPHTFLIDRNGVIRMSHRGGGDLTPIKKKLEELLAEQPASGGR